MNKAREVSSEVEAFRKARLTMLMNQLRLTQEEIDIEVAEAVEDGLSLRRIAPWLEVSYQTVLNWKERGIAARRRRSRHPLDPRGQRGQER